MDRLSVGLWAKIYYINRHAKRRSDRGAEEGNPRAMILVTLALALLFWGRDYLVLRIGPPRTIPRRVWMYSAVVFMMAMLLGTLTLSFGPSEFLAFLRSRQVFVSLIAFHLAAGILCFWLKQTERYDSAWVAAMVPAPGVWFLLAKATFLPAYGWVPFATSLILGLVSALWITLMIVTVLQMSRRQMPVEDMEFAMGLAGWSNCLAIGLVSIAI
jgi:hypothetical protein